MSKPITQRAKSSPFKQVEAVKTEEGKTQQVTKKEEYQENGQGKTVDQAKGGKQATSAGDYLKNLSVSDKFQGVSGQEMVDKGYISSAYMDKWNDMTNYTPPTVTKTREVTTTEKAPDTESTFTPQIEDKTKRVGTVGDYRNNLMVNRSINRDKNLERKQQRDLAKEYARQSGDRKGLFGNFRERRDFMKGKVSNEDIVKTFDALNEKTGGQSGTGAEKLGQYQQNYATMRGLTGKQQGLSKSEGVDRALAQYEQGGNTEVSQFRDFENKDFGTEKGTMTKGNIEKNTGFTVKPGNVTTKETSPGTSTTSVSETSSSSVPTTNTVNGTGAASKSSGSGDGLTYMPYPDDTGGLATMYDNPNGSGSASKASTEVRMKPSMETSFKGAEVPKADFAGKGRKTWKDRVGGVVEKAQNRRAERNAMREAQAANDIVSVSPRAAKAPEVKAPELKPTLSSPTKPAPKQSVAGTGMSQVELNDLAEAQRDNRNNSIRVSNSNLGIENTGNITGNRGEAAAYEAGARKRGEAEAARKVEAEKASRSPMMSRYDQNVGIKHRSPMKKGYFKNK